LIENVYGAAMDKKYLSMAITNVLIAAALQMNAVQEKFPKIYPFHGKFVNGVMI
jgi:hypothetical protein